MSARFVFSTLPPLLLLATTMTTRSVDAYAGPMRAVPQSPSAAKKPGALVRASSIPLELDVRQRLRSPIWIILPPENTKRPAVDPMTPYSYSVVPQISVNTATPAAPLGTKVKAVAKKSFDKYLHWCSTKPLRTKSLSAAVVQGFGDCLSQALTAWSTSQPLVYDFSRTLAFMSVGIFYKGPLLHSWFEALGRIGAWWQRKRNISDGKRTMLELVVDQTIGVLMFYPLYFYAFEILSSMVQLRVPRIGAAHTKCWSTVWSVIMAQYYVWPFAQYISFRYVPKALRVLMVNFVAVFWNCFLCARVAG